MHARITDGVKLVININSISTSIVVICIIFLGVLLLVNKKLTPSTMYEMCVPDIAKICDILDLLKLFVTSFEMLSFSPINIPTIKLLVLFGKILLAVLMILFLISLLIFEIRFTLFSFITLIFLALIEP